VTRGQRARCSQQGLHLLPRLAGKQVLDGSVPQLPAAQGIGLQWFAIVDVAVVGVQVQAEPTVEKVGRR
jgi:hypothetical protein